MKDLLKQATTTGEILRVIYDGGSDPGSVREISPIKISGDKVKAQCLNSGTVKTFLISKLRIPEDSPLERVWSPPPPPPDHSSLDEFFEHYETTFQKLGWVVKREQDCVSLHRSFKNGKVMKGSDVSLDFVEMDFDFEAGLDGEIHKVNQRVRVKPWVVRGKKPNESKSCKRLSDAGVYFNSLADQHAPSSAN
jgi:hypothetical protein